MKGERTELNLKVILKRFREQGGVVTKTADGHLKLYRRVARPGLDDGFVLLAVVSQGGDKTRQSRSVRFAKSVRVALRRNGFDV